jgi:Peptidase family C25
MPATSPTVMAIWGRRCGADLMTNLKIRLVELRVNSHPNGDQDFKVAGMCLATTQFRHLAGQRHCRFRTVQGMQKTLLIIVTLLLPSGLQAADVIAVCPQNFREAFAPWVTHRTTEGLDVQVIDSKRDANELRASICKAANSDTRYVILVGDAPTIGTPCNSLHQVPIVYSPTTITRAWGSTPTLSTDSAYGDFDDDQIPDAVVGRLPVDDNQQLEKLLVRIFAQDQSKDFGPWRGRVQLVGGVGGFGFMADRAIESVTRNLVTGVLPIVTRTNVIYASPGHPFFPKQPFTQSVLETYQQGAQFWVYAGHGQVTALDRVPQSVEGVPVLDQQSVQKLNRSAGNSPIAILLACYTGAIDAPEDSIAEEMVLCEGGPIAVLAGSRVTMPYGNTTAAVGLIDAIYQQQLPRLGDAWLSTMVEMQREASDDTSTTRVMIDTLATLISPSGTKLVDERREHLSLYNLIGDPLLRLHHPRPVAVTVQAGYDSGARIEVQFLSPIEGAYTVELDRPLGSVTEGDPNQTSIAAIDGHVHANSIAKPTFVLPADIHGPMIIRAFVEGTDTWASGAAKTIIRMRK